MFIRRAVIPLLLLMTAMPAAAQLEPISDEPVPPRWVLVPRLAFGSHGQLWGGGENSLSLGATNGPELGAALQFDPDGSFSYELFGSFSPLEYEVEAPDDRDVGAFGAGSIYLVRITGSVFYRIRQNVPGYFIAGAGALYYRPVERLDGSFRADDRSQWMPTVHVGLGYDYTKGGHTLQLGGRLYATRPTQSAVELPIATRTLEAGISYDVLFSIGYRITL